MNDIDLTKKEILGLIFIVLMVLSPIIFRGCCVTFIDSYELGYRYNMLNGQISRVGRTGYIPHPPIVTAIHTIDLRPMQVCISSNSRVLNCKLVKFNPDGLDLFLSWHGRGDYYTSSDTDTQFENILKSYAYDGSNINYPFLEILRELNPEEVK